MRPWKKLCFHAFIMNFLLWGTSNRAAKSKYNTNLARLLPKQICSSIIVDWEIFNNMGSTEPIEEILEIKVYAMGGDEEIFTYEVWRRAFNIREPVYVELCHEFYVTYEFDETVTDEELMLRKVIKFKLGGRGLRDDDHFNVNQYWSEISSENALILSMSSARTIKKPILRVLQKMITYGICQRTIGYYKVQRNELWFMNMFEAKNQNGYANVAWLITRWLKRKGVGSQRESMILLSLDTTTLRELIDSNGRLISKEPAPGDPGAATPRHPCHSISNLYNRMGRMGIRQDEMERMARRQLYHIDRYAGVFEYMSGHYNVPLQGNYVPLSSDEEQDKE
ncbi:hypothetical protein Tco_1419973 [Tanacetum coccineum]